MSTTIHSYIFFLETRIFKIYSFSNFHLYRTVLVTMATMLYLITFSELITGSLYLLTPLIFACSPPTASDNHQFVLCIYELKVFCFFLSSTYKWDHTVFVFLRLISLVANGSIQFFMAEYYFSGCVHHVLYLFIGWQVLGLSFCYYNYLELDNIFKVWKETLLFLFICS